MIKKIQNVQVDIVSICNFVCKHCSVGEHEVCEEMSLDKITDIADQLSEYQVEMLSVSGGEPSLHTKFIDVVKMLAKRFKVKINTNAYNLQLWLKEFEGLQDKLLFQISVDGYDSFTYEYIRQKDCFLEIIKNIQYCRKLGFEVIIKTILSSATKNHVEEIKKMADDLDCQLSIGFLAKQGRECRNKEIALSGEEITEQYKRYRNIYPNILQSGLFSDQLCPLLLKPDSISVLRITSDGTCYPCIAMDHWDLSIGNIYQKNITEMFSDFQYFQKKLLDALYSVKCQECGVRKNSPRPGCFCECTYFSDGTCMDYC